MDSEGKNFRGNYSKYVGAIFMSNRRTKQECLERKLFGLPQSQAGFLKNVKAGMLLFLFEHEERKLYGVFEATSDGALNIIPNAFLSSGTSYPCQILFKRIWMCRPLTEDEFHDAIKENYFAPYKFNFGLSYEQVLRLLNLFSEKKIKVPLPQRRGIPNRIINQFEKFGAGEGRSAKFDSNDHNIDDGTDFRRYPYPGLSGQTANHGVFNENPFTDRQDSMVGIGRGHSMPPQPHYFTCSASQNDHALKGNFVNCPPQYHRHGTFPGFGGEVPSTLGVECPSPQEPTSSTRYRTTLQVPYFGNQLHASQSGPNSLNMPSPVCRDSTFPIYVPSSVNLPQMDSERHPNLQDFKHLPHSEGYNPSSPRISFPSGMDKGTNSLASMLSPTKSHGQHELSRKDYISRGEQFDSGASSDYIHLSGNKNDVLSKSVSSSQKDSTDFQSSYSSESQEVDDSEELKPYLLIRNADEYHPINVNSRLHSDTEQKRTSVFSRLSGTLKTHQHYEEAYEPGTSPSMIELAEIICQRRANWSDMTEVPIEVVAQDNDKQLESIDETEPSRTSFFGELDSSSEPIAEESNELFFDFKRRSESRRVAVETKMIGEDEGFSAKRKRRRLVRPSLSVEEGQNVQGSSQRMGVIMAENFHVKDSGNGSSFRNDIDDGNKNTSPEDNDLRNVATNKSETDSDGLMNPRKGISIQNSRWFVLKSIASQGNVLIAKQEDEEEKTNNASNVPTTGVSLLPVNNDCRDQETGNIKMNVGSPNDGDKIESEDFLPL